MRQDFTESAIEETALAFQLHRTCKQQSEVALFAGPMQLGR
jgi:hypothetical protein